MTWWEWCLISWLGLNCLIVLLCWTGTAYRDWRTEHHHVISKRQLRLYGSTVDNTRVTSKDDEPYGN